MERYQKLIIDYAQKEYAKMLREPDGILQYKFLVPGAGYKNSLWDWDSWLTNIALADIVHGRDIAEYEKGCILNFLSHVDEQGRMPIYIIPTATVPQFTQEKTNIHKPVLAQHAVFICERIKDYDWLKEYFSVMEKYLVYYDMHCKHESGLYFWIDDCAIGVDNDPCTYYRPKGSSASIYLNCLMYQEILAMQTLANAFGDAEKAKIYEQKANELKTAVRENCWDERDGFYYSVDINLLPVDKTQALHYGAPRHWSCLIQRIGVWSGFMAMWAGIATKEQAERMVKNHYADERTFNAPYGVRTLSKMEKMYSIKPTNNPSCWLGPIWGISNYMTFEGLRKYGYSEEAKGLALKTIRLFGEDLEKTGELHEYYHPETGEGLYNAGFQNWNLLVVKMISFLNECN
jgi:putative isomerase